MKIHEQPFAESTRAIVPVFHGGGEIHGCQLDGYRKNDDAFLNRLAEIEQYLSHKNGTLRLWINLDSTKLTKPLMFELVQSLFRCREHIYKASIIGIGTKKRAFQKNITMVFGENPIAIKYYEDGELAKSWLV